MLCLSVEDVDSSEEFPSKEQNVDLKFHASGESLPCQPLGKMPVVLNSTLESKLMARAWKGCAIRCEV